MFMMPVKRYAMWLPKLRVPKSMSSLTSNLKHNHQNTTEKQNPHSNHTDTHHTIPRWIPISTLRNRPQSFTRLRALHKKKSEPIPILAKFLLLGFFATARATHLDALWNSHSRRRALGENCAFFFFCCSFSLRACSFSFSSRPRLLNYASSCSPRAGERVLYSAGRVSFAKQMPRS